MSPTAANRPNNPKTHTSSLEQDIAEYEQAITAHLEGRLDAASVKTAHVTMGVYEQRQDGLFMLRLCVPGGDITPSQLACAAGIAGKYSRSPLHITTRQDLQIHGLALADTPTIMREAAAAGLVSRGGGGNTVRNITQSWDTGFAHDEVFDVAPHVRALTRRMHGQPDWRSLPRKFKIAFSSGPRDTAYATVADLGFIARRAADGTRGFRVYAGGGMGKRSMAGLLLFDFLPEEHVAAVADAVKQYFSRHGDRENRHTARLRFVRMARGDNPFRSELLQEVEQVRAAGTPPLELEPVPFKGRGFVEIPVFLGNLDITTARAIAEIARPWGDESLRLTSAQNILIRNLPERAVPEVRHQLEAAGLLKGSNNPLRNITVCAGASTCRLGICMSRGLVEALQTEIDAATATHERTRDLSIRVSGCPNSCGQHLLADIGFVGAATRGPDGLVPAYTIVTGAVVGDGVTRLAEPGPRIPARRVPAFLGDLLAHVSQQRKEGEPFHQYLEREGHAEIARLAAIHSVTGATDPDQYVDHGTSAPFALIRQKHGAAR